MKTNHFDECVRQSYAILKAQQDLSPHNEVINKTLGLLVNNASAHYEHYQLSNWAFSPETISILPEFRQLCAKAEAALENYWCSYFNQKSTLRLSDLREFPYYQNYVVIAQKELSLISQKHDISKPAKFLFVGSGPLPLSAIFIQQNSSLELHLLDIDPQAITVSQQLTHKLDLPITHHIGDAHCFDFSEYDFVFIASLVPNKDDLVATLNQQNVPFYMIRGADSVYQAFYEDLSDHTKLSRDFLYASSDDQTLNSSYLFFGSRNSHTSKNSLSKRMCLK